MPSEQHSDGITDIQRNTPPWARGISLARWMGEQGVVWSKAEADRVAEGWHAAGMCSRTCDWCSRQRRAAA